MSNITTIYCQNSNKNCLVKKVEEKEIILKLLL